MIRSKTRAKVWMVAVMHSYRSFVCSAIALPHFVLEVLLHLLLFLRSGGLAELVRPPFQSAVELDCLETVEVPGL